MSREIDPQEITALLSLVQAGKLPESDFWTRLRNAGVIDSAKTDEDIREEIDAQPTPASTLGDITDANGGGPPQGKGKPMLDANGEPMMDAQGMPMMQGEQGASGA